VSRTIYTVFLTVTSMAIGTVAGLFLALARLSRHGWLSKLVWGYVWIVRGTPMLLHLFFIYYAAPLFGLTLDAIPAAIIAMSLSASAYTSEIIRAGLQAVHHGQEEAARAIGMTYPAIIRQVVLPQAVRIMIPPYMSKLHIAYQELLPGLRDHCARGHAHGADDLQQHLSRHRNPHRGGMHLPRPDELPHRSPALA
jgi:His/Glu/Gln/Arg/opine family amino acid ABC transporter permease subunit